MLVIRLRRIGRTHDPHYRVVVAEHTSPVQGKFIAEIGHFHPKSKQLVIDAAAFSEWMNKGAKPSNTVAKLSQKQGLKHKHIIVKQYQGQPKKKAQEAAAAATEAKKNPVAETPALEETEATKALSEEETAAAETSSLKETTEEIPEAAEEPTEESDPETPEE